MAESTSDRGTSPEPDRPVRRYTKTIAVAASAVVALGLLGGGAVWAAGSMSSGNDERTLPPAPTSAATADPTNAPSIPPAPTSTPTPTSTQAPAAPAVEVEPGPAISDAELHSLRTGQQVDAATAHAVNVAFQGVSVYTTADGSHIVYRKSEPLPDRVRADLQAMLDATDRLAAAPSPDDYALLQRSDEIDQAITRAWAEADATRQALVIAQGTVGLPLCTDISGHGNCLQWILYPRDPGYDVVLPFDRYSVLAGTADEAEAQLATELQAKGLAGHYEIFVRR